MQRSSKLNRANDADSAHSWLQEKVYAPKRERTVELVKRSIEALLGREERVSLAAIAAASKAIDPEGRGVSESAILGNDQARAYYEQHRSWKGNSRRSPMMVGPPSQTGHIKPERNLARARQRYLRMSKAVLVDRLLGLEQEYAERQERWLTMQDELLQWRLRAEQAEAQLHRQRGKSTE